MSTNIILSIRHRYAEKIYSGEKTIEFRTVLPAKPFEKAYLYETAPVSKIGGYFIPGRIYTVNFFMARAYMDYKKGCITENEFHQYYRGYQNVGEIEIKEALKLDYPLALPPNIRPPQNFVYCGELPVCDVCNDTGYYGDNGPGIIGNAEYCACECPAGEGK